MDKTRRYTATISRPADVTAYSAGDEISNSATAGSVVYATVDLGPVRTARVVRAGVAVTPASSNVVITAFDFALLVFKQADAPAPVGDNVALNITGQQRNKASKFSFANGAWTQPNGGVTAGASAFQEVFPAVAVAGAGATAGPMFDFSAGSQTASGQSRVLTLVLQAQGAWTPLGVVNQFDIALDIEVTE